MADPFGTFRTDEYRRDVPYSEQKTPIGASREPTALDIYGNIVKPGRRWFTVPKTEKELLADHPWVDELADLMVQGRLGVYDTELEGEGDKAQGFIYNKKRKPFEKNSYFVQRVDSKGYWAEPTEAGAQLKITNPAMYQQTKDGLEQSWNTPQFEQSLRRGKREEAGEGESWYRTTNELSDAITNSQNGIGQQYERALAALLQQKFMDEMARDLDSGNPKHINALKNRFMPDWDYEKGMPAYEDFARTQAARREDNNPLTLGEFERPDIITSSVTNAVAPSMSAVGWDPELKYKTGRGEMVGRGLFDSVMLGLPFATVPKAASTGARVGGNIASKMGGRVAPKFLESTGQKAGAWLGGGLAGLGQYGLERAGNQAFDWRTGKGTDEYPLSLADAGAAMVFGGIAGRPYRSYVPYSHGIRTKIDPINPSTVTRGDIADMRTAIADAGRGKKSGTGRVSKDAILRNYRNMEYQRYQDKFPNEAMVVDYPRLPKQGEPKDAYFANNPRFDSWTREQKEALWKAMNSKDPEIRKLFKQGETIYDADQFRENKSVFNGLKLYKNEVPMKNSGLAHLHDEPEARFGTGSAEEGTFSPEFSDQRKARKKADKTSHRRWNHSLLTEKGETEAREKAVKGKARPALQAIGGAIHNIIPWSNTLFGTVPYSYEPETKEEE